MPINNIQVTPQPELVMRAVKDGWAFLHRGKQLAGFSFSEDGMRLAAMCAHEYAKWKGIKGDVQIQGNPAQIAAFRKAATTLPAQRIYLGGA